jgi:hypothetical protein
MGKDRSHETNQNVVTPSEIPVPAWEKIYAFSVAVLDSADGKQLAFYEYFKQRFLNGKVIDVEGNTNYVFALMFDLIDEFRTHRDQEMVVQQLTNLETAYPVIQRYTEENLADAIEGKAPKRDPAAGIGFSIDLTDVFKEIELEHPEWFSEDGDDSEDDELGQDDLDDYTVEDDDDGTEKFRFPPSDPIYTVTLVEKLDSGYNCLETNITLNNSPLAKLKARLISLRADLDADRLFIQTMYSENEDSFSLFCFELSTGKRLWQTKDIPPGGSLLLDTEQYTIEAGVTYGEEDNYLVLLDYSGNIIERNFRDGYQMIEAADLHYKNEVFEEAKPLYLRALDTAVSISTRIRVAKRLARIGKLTGDNILFTQFTARAVAFETEKTAENDRAAAESAREQLPLAARLASRPAGDDNTSQILDEDDKPSVYWQKRRQQINEEGGR